MTSQLTVKAVDRYEDYYHVRFRDADEFDELETPDWASELVEAELPRSEVWMGQDETDEWLVQSVRVPVNRMDDEGDASRKALQVVSLITDYEMFDSK